MKIGMLVILVLAVSCGPGRNNKTFEKLSSEDQIKFDKYYILGSNLYKANCSNCHQTDGKGLRRLIPTLVGSDYLQKYQAESAKLIRDGATKSIHVNGVMYKPTMPALPHLTPLEVAEILTYINNSWGNEYGFVDEKKVRHYLFK